VARRIAKVQLLGPKLDDNYRICANGAYQWRVAPGAAAPTTGILPTSA
jgi:hypothetical protein